MAEDLKPVVAAAFGWYLLTIGAYSMIGPARDALLMARFGPQSLPWVYLASAALTGAVVWAYSRFARQTRRRLIGGALVFLALTLGGGGLASAAAGSRAVSFFYFLWCDVFGIMAVTLFWTYADDVFSAAEASAVFGPISAAAPIGSIFGRVDVWTGVGSFVAGALLTTPALSLLGTAGCLLTAGLANLGLFVLYPAAPGLRLAAAFVALEGVARYTWFKSAKERTYTATGKDVLYRVKAFVEMFVYRFARGGAGFLLLGARFLGWGGRGAALLGVPLAALWMLAAARVGREHARLARGV